MKKIIMLFLFLVIFLLANTALTPDALQEIAKHRPKEEGVLFDSLNVRYVGSWCFQGIEDFVCDTIRNLVFCSSGKGVYTLKIKDDSALVKISDEIRTRSSINGLWYDNSGKKLYISSYKTGLSVWDVADPAKPEMIGRLKRRWGGPIAAKDTLLYVCAGLQGIRICSISDPRNPMEIAKCDIRGSGFSLQDSVLFVLGDGFLKVINIADPKSCFELSNMEVRADTTEFGCGSFITIKYPYAFITQAWHTTPYSGRIQIIDISNLREPKRIGKMDTHGAAQGLFIAESLAYVCDNATGLTIFDISDPKKPHEISVWYSKTYSISSHFRDKHPSENVHICRGTAVVSNYSKITLADVTDPCNPKKLSEFEAPGKPSAVHISNQYAYVTDRKGLRILDISDLSFPIEVGFIKTPGNAFNITLSGSIAYIADGHKGVCAIDISDPTEPIEIDSELTKRSPRDIHVSGLNLYVGSEFDGLWIFEITNGNLHRIGEFDTTGSIWNFFVSEPYVYKAGRYPAFSVIDVSNPSDIKRIGYYNMGGTYRDVYVVGSYAYCTSRGVDILDFSNTSDIKRIGKHSSFADYDGIVVSGSYAFAVDHSGALSVIDISDPTEPKGIGYYELLTGATRILMRDNYLFVITRHEGLEIYEFIPPTRD